MPIACTGAFLAFLDATIVNIAFPDIASSFAGSGRDALSWVLDGYFVVIAALLVPAGGLADRFGHQRIFLLGDRRLHGAPACSARWRPRCRLLIAFRVVQGVGAAMIAPASLAIVLDSFPVEKRAAGVGLWGAAAAAAAAVGPTLGGALVELSDWRLVFLVNLPLGVAILLAGYRLLPARPPADSRLPTCRVRCCWRSAWRRSRWRSSRATTGAGAPPRPCGCFAALRAAARRRRLPQPPPPAPDRRAGAVRRPRLRRSATSAPCSSPPPSSR